MRKRGKLGIAAAAAMTCALTTLSTTASAVPSEVAAGGTAPACIDRYVHGDGASLVVRLTNYCNRQMSVQVIISWGNDSPCFVIREDSYVTWRYSGTGTYDRTAVC